MYNRKAMIKEIRYKNFKALRDTTLPLGRFTLIVGANGTGKSTALKALKIAKKPQNIRWDEVVSAKLPDSEDTIVSVIIKIDKIDIYTTWKDESDRFGTLLFEELRRSEYVSDQKIAKEQQKAFNEWVANFSLYSFDAEKISQTVPVSSEKDLKENGENLAGILDLLRDTEPERWKELNDELERWFPEFDQILFDRNDEGKYIVLRTKFGKHKIKAKDLSDGTRIALAYLTLAYLPNPPKIVAFEEPEKGIHPRLLRNIQEAMDRLAYPENFGEKREPIQVIATTHSPYLLDLYKDRREEIVIADKDEKGVHFQRLSELPHIDEILRGQDIPLGDVWFTGILGGVPIQP